MGRVNAVSDGSCVAIFRRTGVFSPASASRPRQCIPYRELRNPDAGNAGAAPRWSERLDGGFRLQQDRNPIADGVHPLAFVTLQGVLAAQYQRLAAYRAGEYFQQIRADHGLLILTGYCLPLLS